MADTGGNPDADPASDLRPDRLAPLLGTRWLGCSYQHLTSCRSTNDEVARLASEGAPAGLVVAAETQTGGRGRLGRSWQSPAGQNLYLSLLLRPDCTAMALPPLTLVAGAAVASVLASLGVRPRLKWPNDLLIDGAAGPRKLAGILTEMSTLGDRVRHVVLGIGLNVNQPRFPPELEGIATSLQLAIGRQTDRAELLATLLNRLEPAFERALSGEVAASLADWRRFAELPRPCRLEREPAALEGTAEDIAPDGALLVRDARGQLHRVVSGELAAG